MVTLLAVVTTVPSERMKVDSPGDETTMDEGGSVKGRDAIEVSRRGCRTKRFAPPVFSVEVTFWLNLKRKGSCALVLL